MEPQKQQAAPEDGWRLAAQQRLRSYGFEATASLTSPMGRFHSMRPSGFQVGSERSLQGWLGNSVKLQPEKAQVLCSCTAWTTAMPVEDSPSRFALPHP